MVLYTKQFTVSIHIACSFNWYYNSTPNIHGVIGIRYLINGCESHDLCFNEYKYAYRKVRRRVRSSFLCDNMLPTWEILQVAVGLTMLYKTNHTIKKTQGRWMCGPTRVDHMRNDFFKRS